MTRRVVRFALIGERPRYNADRLRDVADMLAKEATDGSRMAPKEYKIALARALTAIAAGANARRVFELTKPRGGQLATERHKFLALDYWLYRRLYPEASHAYDEIAARWHQDSIDTIKGITRRYRRGCESFLDSIREPLPLYEEAVAAARYEIHTGKSAPIDMMQAEEDVEVVIDWSPLLARFLV